jgi:hypothetical protein
MHTAGTPYPDYPSPDHRGRGSAAVGIRLLGGFRVTVGARIKEENVWRLRKAAVVKLLALAPSHHLHCEQAMDILWPDADRRPFCSFARGDY